MTTHLLTMGGGGFSMSVDGSPTGFDRYLLELTGKSSPLVCFVPTASADDPTYINRFLNAYGTLGVSTMILTLWQGASDSVNRLPEADIVLVGGGSTVNLIALWQAHGVDHLLKRISERNDSLILAGISAGGSCWYEGCITDSFGEARAWRGGLGLVKGSFCPHFDGEENRAPCYIQAVANGLLPGGYGCDDGAGLHFIDGQLYKAIRERKQARVMKFEPSNEPNNSGVSTEFLDSDLI